MCTRIRVWMRMLLGEFPKKQYNIGCIIQSHYLTVYLKEFPCGQVLLNLDNILYYTLRLFTTRAF